MPLWPIAVREARTAARSPRTYAWRAAVTAIGIAIVPISLWISGATTSQGRAVFIGISATAFFYCLFGGVLRTADAIAEEKRENTLGLLFLTDLKVGDVLSGKLLASTATLFFGLLALMPLLSIPVLLGGVTSRELIRMALCLANTLFFSISCGFLVSTLLRQGWMTISCGLAAMFVFAGVVPLISSRLPDELRSFVAPFSPSMTVSTIFDDAPLGVFLQSLAVIHLLAWLGLLYTAHYLPHFWQERPRSVRAEVRFQKVRKLRFGGSTTRKRFRTRLLNRNPLFWLSGREQVSSAGLMTFMMCIVALSLFAGGGDWLQVLLGLAALHAALLVRMSSAASHALAEDRKSGALELLLATSLSVREVLRGRWMGLGRQFFGPIIIVTFWHLFAIIWLSVMGPRAENVDQTLFVFLLALMFSWIAIGWFGLWMGLRARHPIAAIWSTLTAVVLAPWLVMAGLFSILASFQIVPEFNFGSDTKYLTEACVVWGIYLFTLNIWSARKVRRAFREAATDRYSDTQPIDWRPFWRITWKIAALTILIIGSVWSARLWINSRGERALHAALAAHPGFTLESPQPAFIPDEKNLAQWGFLKLLNGPQPIPPFRYSHLGGLVAWRNGGRYVQPTSIEPRMLEKDEKELADLKAAARERPYFRFTQRPLNPGFSWTPNFSVQEHMFSARLAALAERRLLRSERPLDDILLALRFANSFTNEPQSMGGRHYLTDFIIQPIYDGILDARWTDSDLQTIQKAFSDNDPAQQLESWRADVIRKLLNVITDGPKSNPMFGPNMIVIGNMPYYFGRRTLNLRLPGKIKEVEAEVIKLGFAWGTKDPRTLFGTPPNDEFMAEVYGVMYNSLRQAFLEYAPLKARSDQVVAACAIERYRLATGALPKSLEELRPKYLASLPIDPMNNRPMKYLLKPNGYVLYAVGEDGTDDGGVPEYEKTQGRSTQIRGDWVWIYRK